MEGSPTDSDDVVEDTGAGPVLRIRVRPRSARRGVLGTKAGMLVVGVGAPPEGGKATAEALRALGAWLGIAPSRLTVVSGAAARSKRIRVNAETASGLRRRVSERLSLPPSKRSAQRPRNRS